MFIRKHNRTFGGIHLVSSYISGYCTGNWILSQVILHLELSESLFFPLLHIYMTAKIIKDIRCGNLFSFHILAGKSQDNIYIFFQSQAVILLVYLHGKCHFITDGSTLGTNLGHQIATLPNRDYRLRVITACHQQSQQANGQ